MLLVCSLDRRLMVLTLMLLIHFGRAQFDAYQQSPILGNGECDAQCDWYVFVGTKRLEIIGQVTLKKTKVDDGIRQIRVNGSLSAYTELGNTTTRQHTEYWYRANVYFKKDVTSDLEDHLFGSFYVPQQETENPVEVTVHIIDLSNLGVLSKFQRHYVNIDGLKRDDVAFNVSRLKEVVTGAEFLNNKLSMYWIENGTYNIRYGGSNETDPQFAAVRFHLRFDPKNSLGGEAASIVFLCPNSTMFDIPCICHTNPIDLRPDVQRCTTPTLPTSGTGWTNRSRTLRSSFWLPNPRNKACPNYDGFLAEKFSIHPVEFYGGTHLLQPRHELGICNVTKVPTELMPDGHYCVIGQSGECSGKFTESTDFRFKNSSDVILAVMTLCCTNTQNIHTDTTVRWSGPFYLIPYTDHCQKIYNYSNRTEHVSLRLPEGNMTIEKYPASGNQKGIILKDSRQADINLCYYEPKGLLTDPDKGGFLVSVIIAVGVFFTLLSLPTICVCRRKRQKRAKRLTASLVTSATADLVLCKMESYHCESQKECVSNAKKSLDIGSILKLVLDPESQLKIYTILLKPDKLELQEKIGQGAFGTVYFGRYRPDGNPMNCKEVAIKTLKDTCVYPEISGFVEEALVMADFNHNNVLSLIGVCIKAETEIPMIVLPHMHYGDLQTFCRKFRYEDTMNDTKPDESLLISFSLQVARGMGYLAGLKFVHRDLAARNCMLDKNMVVKVADFGLTRDVYSNCYYRQDKQKLLPIKWMALESLQDRVFTTYTDVWSYGVTIWEIFTLGKVPYPDIQNFQVMPELEKGVRLPKPASCPDKIFEILLKCWSENPKERPTFSVICKELDAMLCEFSEYLDLVNEQEAQCDVDKSITDEKDLSNDGNPMMDTSFPPFDTDRKDDLELPKSNKNVVKNLEGQFDNITSQIRENVKLDNKRKSDNDFSKISEHLKIVNEPNTSFSGKMSEDSELISVVLPTDQHPKTKYSDYRDGNTVAIP